MINFKKVDSDNFVLMKTLLIRFCIFVIKSDLVADNNNVSGLTLSKSLSFVVDNK